MRKMLPRMSKLHTIYDVCGILDNSEGSVLSEKNIGPLRFWNEFPPGYQYDCECYVRWMENHICNRTHRWGRGHDKEWKMNNCLKYNYYYEPDLLNEYKIIEGPILKAVWSG